MANPQGAPIEYGLMTSDAPGLQDFYADVVCWSVAPSEMEGPGDYRILAAPDYRGVGGTVTMGTHQVPGSVPIVTALDTQGGGFARVGGN